MSETQLASMFIGSADDGDGIDRVRPSDVGNMIHIVNPQTSEILDYITLDNIIDDTHKKSLESYLETYDAIVLGGSGFSYDKHLEKRNHIIIPDEDGTYQEFILFEVDKYRDTEGRKTHFYAHATYLELKKAKVIYPTRREGLTLSQHAGWALNDTGWRVGIVESEGVRTFNIENHTNPYEFIKRIANEFEVEIRFRVEHDGRRITARYVDFLERIGDWKGREVEFGKDLDSIRRVEKQDIVTALLGLGPERDDGTRIEVLVTDEEALQRWGRVDEHGNLHHLIEPYEIQSERTEMTEEEARRYTRTALDKRINTQVTYETTILDLEEVPGLEHEKIRFGDTIRIKDTYFNPPLYLEARVFEIERSIKNKAKKDIKLGDYIEYTEEEVNAIWNQLRNEIRRRLDRMAIVTINSTAGNVFKNAQGTTELTARTFVSGAERDEQGTLYDYQWMRFDKDGNHDTSFYAEGKTITVTANDIDEKATYRVLVAYELEVINTAEITISNVFDGEPGPPGPKGDIGQGVEDVTPQYYLSNSDSALIGGTWTETKPPYQKNKYLWTRNKITYKNPTEVEYTTPVLDDSWKAIERAEEAKEDAQEAKQTAQQAQTTADGKNTVFRQSSQPPTSGRKIGDVWFDTSRDNLMHVFNGTQWVQAKWGEQSIVANSITANHIKSLVGLNVNDQFIVDSQGNVKFAGHLEGATGVFSGEIKTKKLRIKADSVHDFYDFGIDIETAQWQPDLDNPFKRTGYISFITGNDTLEIHRTDTNGDPKPLAGFFVDADHIWFTGKMELSPYYAGTYGDVLTLSGGNANHVYIEFYRSVPSERSAYIGIPTANSEHFIINAHGVTGELRLAGANVHITQRLINPQTYNVTVQSPANVYVTSNGYFARSTSSKRYKADIQYNDIDYKKILKLQQASWVDRNEFENNNMSAEGLKRYYGAIAEDFERIGLSEYVVYNEETGEVENFSDRAWVLLIPNINDILEELEQLKERLERLENEGNSV